MLIYIYSVWTAIIRHDRSMKCTKVQNGVSKSQSSNKLINRLKSGHAVGPMHCPVLRFCHRHRQNLPHVAVLCLQVSKQRMPEILKEVPDWRPVEV